MIAEFTLNTDPTWPWSLGQLGLPALAVLVLLLTGITIWTYLGVHNTTTGRLLTILALRLAALLLAFSAVLRPAFGFRGQIRAPSTLLIAVDDSESMSIQDEYDGQSRWDHARRILRKCEPELRKLHDDHEVNVVLVRFSEGVRPLDLADESMRADGKRSDYGLMLRNLYDRYGGEAYLRGLVVLGDGADNGTRHDPLAVAGEWRDKPSPIHTFAFGKKTTTDQQSDIALTDITVLPSPVPAKGKMKITAIADAPGFEGKPRMFHVFIDDKEVPILVGNKEEIGHEIDLPLTRGNELQLECNAPAQPGEVKVTVKIEPDQNELIRSNNEISTFASVTKEGVSVLYVDKRREELGFVARALATDPRIRVTYVLLGGSGGSDSADRNLFHFDDRPYDVVIIGDVTYDEVSKADRMAPAKIKELVGKGAGVMMIGGERNFAKGGWQGKQVGNHWEQSELRDVLPVDMSESGSIKAKTINLKRTDIGTKHFLLRLDESDQENERVWRDELKLYGGMSAIGRPKANIGEPLLVSAADDNINILVAADVNGGRSLAFAGDTTHEWVRPPKGAYYFERFWRQMVLWLAHQEKTESKVWIKPDARRVKTGHRLGFSVGIRGKDGFDLKGASFTPKLIGPAAAVWKSRENGEDRIIVEPNAPGEYQLIVEGKGKDASGDEVSGQDKVRFLVSQDDAEMARRAADPEFLKRLAAAGGGKFHLGEEEELAAYLRDLPSQPLGGLRPKANLWPDWRRNDLSLFPPTFLALFVGLVSLEWFFRRRWGMV